MLLPPQTPQTNRQCYTEQSKQRDTYIHGAIAWLIQAIESPDHPFIANEKN
jgi:hypothetical protein